MSALPRFAVEATLPGSQPEREIVVGGRWEVC